MAHHARLAVDRPGKFAAEGSIQPLFENSDFRQGGQQRMTDCAVRRRVGQIATRGEQGDCTRRGKQENLEYRRGRAFISFVFQPQRCAKPGLGVTVDFVLGDDILLP